jgi:hypothetical protein
MLIPDLLSPWAHRGTASPAENTCFYIDKLATGN